MSALQHLLPGEEDGPQGSPGQLLTGARVVGSTPDRALDRDFHRKRARSKPIKNK